MSLRPLIVFNTQGIFITISAIYRSEFSEVFTSNTDDDVYSTLWSDPLMREALGASPCLRLRLRRHSVSPSPARPLVPGAGPRSVQLSRHTRNPNTGPNKGHEVSRAAAGIGRRARCELIAKLTEENVNVEVTHM